jgi:hypothetical protein
VSLANLPDETPVWIDGHGQATLGELRHAPKADETLSERERTLNMWRDIAALNTNRHPWEPKLTYDQVRTYHRIRSPSDPPRPYD